MPQNAGRIETIIASPRFRTGVLVLLIGLIVAPVLYYRLPWFVHSPDIYYLKAKVMWIMQGHILTDPITGYETFHPPFYYIVLAGLTSLGLSIDTVLVLVTLVNVILFITVGYKIIARVFGPKTALPTFLLIMFIIEFMGSRNIILASSFHFSLPLYMIGLWFYITANDSLHRAAVASVFWGVAFLISPVYVFLIGLTFIYDTITHKSWRRLLIMTASFIIVLPLFFYQAYTVYSKGLHHTSTFMFWRGFPDAEWLGRFFTEFLSPSLHKLLSIPAAISLLLIIIALIAIIKRRRVHWYIIIAAISYILTFYHFSGQYAIRIQLLLSIFIVATAIHYLRRTKLKSVAWLAPLMILVVFSFYYFYTDKLEDYDRWFARVNIYHEAGSGLWDNMDQHLKRGEYIISTKETYFQFIMPFYPVHSLGAWKTMEYYQLDTLISNQLEFDYRAVHGANSYVDIMMVADKYNITTSVASIRDFRLPLFKMLSDRWTIVYEDDFFRIYKKP
jgi:hypothetical protein